MSDPTSPTAPDAAAPDVLAAHRLVILAATPSDGGRHALDGFNDHAVVDCIRDLAAEVRRLAAGLARLRAPADLAAVKARAAAAVDAIIADGSDRRGVLNLYACDDDIRDEIVATWRAAVAREIVAAVVENTGACNSHAVALLAAEREGHAAEVAGARAAALREAGEVCCAHANRYVDPALRFVAAQCGNAIAALTTKGAPDV